MLSVLSLMSKIVFFPVWGLWRVYLMLWWAFDTRPASAPATAEPGVQDSAFQVTSSNPEPLPLPRGALRGGFVGTWLVSIALGVVCAALADQNILEPGRAAIAWGWGSALTTVTSLLAVRAVVGRQRAKVSRVQRAKEGIRDGVRAVAAGVAPKAARASVMVAATACKIGAAGCRGIAGAMEKAAPAASRFGSKFREAMRRAGGLEPTASPEGSTPHAPASTGAGGA
ncbi:MAG: hypothetical protein JNL50_04860 [Phycisphaerae bacterium]|nr:hypothetical protein [Phycisphaerae bacterium]